MKKNNIIQPYKKDSHYSYASGAYATIELLSARPEQAEKIIIHSAYKDSEGLAELCRQKCVEIHFSDKEFKRINQKENTYVLGIFSKYDCKLSFDRPHVVLVNPSDKGNLGTIIRTLAGFNINDLAIITPAADFWDPKVIRASMGAIFRINVEQFASFEEYSRRYPQHSLYPFMTDGETDLIVKQDCPLNTCYSLIFGNEAAGLPEKFRNVGTCFRIAHSEIIDSLNLSVAVGIGVCFITSALPPPLDFN